MTLSDETRRLTQHFLEAYDARMAAVIGIRTGTAQELAEFHAAHQAMSAKQRQRLNEHMEGLRHDVAELRREAGTFLKELDAAHQAMATEQRQRLSKQADELRSQLARSEETGAQLATERNELAQTVSRLDLKSPGAASLAVSESPRTTTKGRSLSWQV